MGGRSGAHLFLRLQPCAFPPVATVYSANLGQAGQGFRDTRGSSAFKGSKSQLIPKMLMPKEAMRKFCARIVATLQVPCKSLVPNWRGPDLYDLFACSVVEYFECKPV
jgi:hypothetical protein